MRTTVSKSDGGVRWRGRICPEPHLAVTAPCLKGGTLHVLHLGPSPWLWGMWGAQTSPWWQRAHGCPSAGLPLMSLGQSHALGNQQERGSGLFSYFGGLCACQAPWTSPWPGPVCSQCAHRLGEREPISRRRLKWLSFSVSGSFLWTS